MEQAGEMMTGFEVKIFAIMLGRPITVYPDWSVQANDFHRELQNADHTSDILIAHLHDSHFAPLWPKDRAAFLGLGEHAVFVINGGVLSLPPQ
jgi:hypothetical protein